LGLANIKRLFTDQVFQTGFKNTLVFVVVTVGLNIAITLLLAQIISTMRRNWMRSFFRVLFFMPCVAPLVAASVVWGGLYATQYGLINNILYTFFFFFHHNWLGNPGTVMPAIIIFTIWADIGYNIVIFCAGIDGIPDEFNEAAAIDGAGPIKRFFAITLPLLGRTISFVLVMTLISHFQMFAQFQVLTRSAAGRTGGTNNAGLVMTLYVYKQGFEFRNMGYASAVALVLFLVIMVFSAISKRLSRVDWGY
jgi:multiple sugar transport system permease protein/raffinose/stachyose/melibiose transport system permease protein